MGPQSARARRWCVSASCSAARRGPRRRDAALLADGNIGIEGDPPALVRRTRNLLMPGIVVAVAQAVRASSRRNHARLRTAPRSVAGSTILVGINQIGGSPRRPACANEARAAASPPWPPLGCSAPGRDRGRRWLNLRPGCRRAIPVNLPAVRALARRGSRGTRRKAAPGVRASGRPLQVRGTRPPKRHRIAPVTSASSPAACLPWQDRKRGPLGAEPSQLRRKCNTASRSRAITPGDQTGRADRPRLSG